MEVTGVDSNGKKSINVLLVGNNPGEISEIDQHINTFKKPVFRTSIAFNLRRIFRRIRQFKPASILIDDRLNIKKLRRLIRRLHRNHHTRDIPVTIIKSSNSEFGIKHGIDDYVLKDNLTPDNLRRTILNSRRRRKTNIFLYKSYKKSRNLIQKIWLNLRYGFRYS